ncbi:MAG TPA: DUF5995 family protein [Solirubrobacteraceae bacterium]|nr:DUF5995 family protein [Solirubrobacteraceae bacterium]
MLRKLLSTLGVAISLLAMPAAADARRDWAAISPGLTMAFDPASKNVCNAGATSCVDAVLAEMERRYAPLAASCDHDAIFALAYLRTTEAYRQAIEDPRFFSDTAFVNHEDALFAKLYFDAFDAWHAGAAGATPAAWAIALRAADRREVSGAGNLLLGINAHVQRDLPYVLHGVGLVKPDGSSRKPDHDKVNQILEQVYPPLLEELARDYDPTIDDTNLPTDVDDKGLFQIVVAWREIAWRNAERLAAARTALEREAVALSIETYAASQAEAIRLASAYVAPLQSSAARDAYCAARM